MWVIYLVLRFATRACDVVWFLVAFLALVPFCNCDSWLALVRGNLSDELLVPGRTGPPQFTTDTTLEINNTAQHQNFMSLGRHSALKANISIDFSFFFIFCNIGRNTF